MVSFVLRRFLAAIPVFLAVTFFVFSLMHLSPGDPVMMLLPDYATQEQIDEMRAAWGLDKPFFVQYLVFLGRAVQGDFGRSIVMGDPVTKLVLERLPATIELALVSLVLALVLAVPIGVLSAVKQNSIFDHLGMVGALFGISVPGFWLGIILIFFLGVGLRLFPVSGRIGYDAGLQPMTGFYLVDSLLSQNLYAFGEALRYVALPAIALGARTAGLVARISRSSVLEVIREDYVRAARAKGLREHRVLRKHVLSNALIPIVTVIGLQLGFLLSSTIVVEAVFGWPGIGSFLVLGIGRRDYTLVQGIVFFYAVSFIAINFLVDIAYGLVDPRVKVE